LDLALPPFLKVGAGRGLQICNWEFDGSGTCADLKKKQNPPPPPSVHDAVWCGGEGGDR